MTSTSVSMESRPVRHAFTIALKEGLAVGGVAALLLGIVIAVPAAMAFGNINLADRVVYCFGEPDVAAFYTVLAALMGVVQGLFAFKLLCNRSASTAYFGLGLSRRQLFAVRYASGALWLTAAAAVAMAAGTVVNLMNSAHTGLILSRGLYIGAGLVSTALLAYSLTCLVCTLTGTVAEALAYSLLAALLPTLVLAGLSWQMSAFLWGSPYGLRDIFKYDLPASLASELTILNPLLFFYPYMDAYTAQITGQEDRLLTAPPMTWMPALGWLMAAAVLVYLARRFFIGRRVENTGIRGACKPLGFAVTLPAVYAAGSVFLSMTSGYDPWPVGGALAAGVALSATVFCALALPLRLAERTAWRGLLAYPACLAASGLIMALLSAGGLGFAQYTPGAGDVRSMEISYKGMPDLLLGDSYGWGSSIVQSNNNTVITLTEPEDIALGISLHRALLEDKPALLAAASDATGQTAVSSYTMVRYMLKSGQTVTRFYTEATYELLSRMLALDETRAFTELWDSDMDSEEPDGSDIYFSRSPYTSGILYLTTPLSDQAILLDDDTALRVRQALKEDFAAMEPEDRYLPGEAESYVLYFTLDEGRGSGAYSPIPVENIYNIGMSAPLCVNAAFAQTTALLGEYADQFDSPELEWIEVSSPFTDLIQTSLNADPSPIFRSYSQPVSATDRYAGASPFRTDDPDQMAELYAASRGFYFAGDDGYLIFIKIKDANRIAARYIPRDLLPSWASSK